MGHMRHLFQPKCLGGASNPGAQGELQSHSRSCIRHAPSPLSKDGPGISQTKARADGSSGHVHPTDRAFEETLRPPGIHFSSLKIVPLSDPAASGYSPDLRKCASVEPAARSNGPVCDGAVW
eukprot:CAMPEP_0174372844 /NCGR_PEP_ID=MMETSP0811_2-20130205/104898_1 /TAXON_ID=73025 ORGANISM="Eutreptiella gymnastica-like, Strain CCMP1594" /NCGR_SAMPLE_ID=MMETSP0811_2 /ASSEMBLY_ACC=CAM_ASM_000667 /LENGTH=121 /DNA_ID=CAMNT_0015520593 /DNA_START=255 /DNA_END=617 /DNA_ORIENTATION=+